MTVLLLRPSNKIKLSCVNFEQAGLSVVGLPLLDIQTDASELTRLKQQLKQQPLPDKIFVLSTNAAQITVTALEKLNHQCDFFAVGKSSAKHLQAAGIQVTTPSLETTEGLLQLPELQHNQNCNIYLLKGHGGRQLLAQKLREQNAKVTEFYLYRRIEVVRPEPTSQWQPEQITCIIATSGTLIKAAFAHLEPTWLVSKPWIVVSERTAKLASKLGVKQISICEKADDRSLIDAFRTNIGAF